MRGISVLLLLFFLAAPSIAAADDISIADFENQYSDAALIRGSEAVKGTDLLVRDITYVLHKENMAILSELEKLRKDIADIKKDVKSTRDQVESGQ